MSAVYRVIIRQRIHLLLYRIAEQRTVTPRQIYPSDRTIEKHITRNDHVRLVIDQRNMPRCMSGNEKNIEHTPSETQLLPSSINLQA
jgi:hypothetical protein